jgi:hypothetical protein
VLRGLVTRPELALCLLTEVGAVAKSRGVRTACMCCKPSG